MGASRGLETGVQHGVSWQASPQAHVCHTFLKTALGMEAQRPRSDRMRHPGIPGKERWAEVGPLSGILRSSPLRGWLWEEVTPQA